MTNHWAIIIGINHYPSLQSLLYAQRDASDLRQFLVQEVGLNSQHCILLSEVSPSIEELAVYPGREEIQTWINHICLENLSEEDLLWFFFSGYGVQFEGQDYLLPINSDPEHIPETALAIKSLFEIFKQAPTNNVLVVLDINRSQGSLPGQQVGAQTIELAKDFGIPTLLSCQPDQFSQETFGVRHGLFSVALLEGMRYHGCVTLSHLAEYISDRLPELSEHHCRPQQTPVAIIPPEKKFLMVIPPNAVTRLPMTEAAAARYEVNPLDLDFTDSQTTPPFSGQDAAEQSAGVATVSSPYPPQLIPPTKVPPMAGEAKLIEAPTTAAESKQSDTLRNWGILAATVLLLGVLYRNSPILFPFQDPPSPSTSPTVPQNTSVTVEEFQVQGGGAEDSEAIAAMRPTPENLTDNLSQANSPEARAQLERSNQARLEAARFSIRSIQASQFHQAITQASRIQPGQPFYEQAQRDIDRWSRLILDLAEGRAAERNFTAALAAAELIPPNRSISRLAQRQIDQWRILQQALNSLQAGQASSFHDAIMMVLRQLPADQPEYSIAQQLTNKWSQDILSIARARAAQGRFQDAIYTASLVPKETLAYNQAQAEIQRWQE